MTFDEWLRALNEAAIARGYEGYSMTPGDTLSDDTGEDCWRDYFDEGFTPLEALAEDEANA